MKFHLIFFFAIIVCLRMYGQSMVVNDDTESDCNSADQVCNCVNLDFEGIEGVTLYEGLPIGDQFLGEYGMSFKLEGGEIPVLAQVGSPGTAFRSSWGNDRPTSSKQSEIGEYFLTDDGVLSGLQNSPLIITFFSPVDSASGVLLDIDFGETFIIEGRNAMDSIVATTQIRDGDINTGDGSVTPWSILSDTAQIKSIKIIGSRTQAGSFGLGFDNFTFCTSNRGVSFTSQSVCLGEPNLFQFESPLTNIDSVSWDFGDGSISNMNNPSYTYENAGDYLVTLSAYHDNFNSVFRDSIKVYELPSFDLGNDIVISSTSDLILDVPISKDSIMWSTGDTLNSIEIESSGDFWAVVYQNGCEYSDTIRVDTLSISVSDVCFGQANTFHLNTSLIDIIDSVRWNLGDTILHLINSSYTFKTSGQKRISATVFYDGKYAFVDTLITVFQPPNVELGANRVLGFQEAISLNAFNQNSTYLWNTGQSSSAITVDEAGIYSVEVLNEFGCIATDTIKVDTLNISVENVCFGETASFHLNTSLVNVIDSVLWDFGEALSTDIDPSHVFRNIGQKVVKVAVYYDSLIARADTILTIHNIPLVDLGSDTTLFYGQNITLDATNSNSLYTWNDGSNNSTLTVGEPGEYSVIVTNEFGCSTSDNITVAYDQLIEVSLGNDTTICQDASIKLDLYQEGLTYKWSTGETSPSILISDSATIWVKITNAYGTRTLQDTILISEKSFGSLLTNDTLICEPARLLLTAKGAQAHEYYNWYDSDFTFLEQNMGEFKTDELSSSRQFFVSITDTQCESKLESIQVTYGPPVASILNTDTTLILGESIQLQGVGGISYEWSPTTYLSDPFVQNPIATPEDNITYTLLVTNEDGCIDDTEINLIVQLELVFNNTFTPNNDGTNDTWILQNLDRFPNHVIQIFDRFGNELEEFRDYQNDWEGIVHGTELPTGTYFYLIDLGNGKNKRGSITIIR